VKSEETQGEKFECIKGCNTDTYKKKCALQIKERAEREEWHEEL